MNSFGSNKYLLYLLKFGVIFCILYFGTLGIIGLASTENNYSPFVASYLDYISPLRKGLLLAGKGMLQLVGCSTNFSDEYTLVFTDDPHRGIRMVYSCIGYGVLSFWAAFVLANSGSIRYKTLWLIGGLLALCFLNVLRIFWLMLSIRSGWPVPFGLDHHTVFNIAAYLLIFFMIYLYDKQAIRQNKQTTITHAHGSFEVQ